jgi:hypothetical protein
MDRRRYQNLADRRVGFNPVDRLQNSLFVGQRVFVHHIVDFPIALAVDTNLVHELYGLMMAILGYLLVIRSIGEVLCSCIKSHSKSVFSLLLPMALT